MQWLDAMKARLTRHTSDCTVIVKRPLPPPRRVASGSGAIDMVSLSAEADQDEPFELESWAQSPSCKDGYGGAIDRMLKK